jgi:hypothetical protein
LARISISDPPHTGQAGRLASSGVVVSCWSVIPFFLSIMNYIDVLPVGQTLANYRNKLHHPLV